MFANVSLLLVFIAALCCQSFAQDTSSTIVSWISYISLDGVGATSFNSADQKVLIATTAETYGFPSSSVTYNGQGAAVLNGGGAYMIIANMAVNVLLGDTTYTSAAELYTNSTAALTEAVALAPFEVLLQQNAAANNAAPHLQSASAYNTTYTAYTTAEKINKDENLDLTQGGVAIIVICCLVMFFVVLYMAWGATHATHQGDHGKPNATKGYAISEDEV